MSRKLKQRGGRWQADFREFGSLGGGRETLRAPGERYGVTSRAEAERLYDRRLAELLRQRADEPLTTSPSAIERRLPSTAHLSGLLDDYIGRLSSTLDPRVTRDRRRYADIICQLLPPTMLVRAIDSDTLNVFLVALRDEARSKVGTPFASQTRLHVMNCNSRRSSSRPVSSPSLPWR